MKVELELSDLGDGDAIPRKLVPSLLTNDSPVTLTLAGVEISARLKVMNVNESISVVGPNGMKSIKIKLENPVAT